MSVTAKLSGGAKEFTANYNEEYQALEKIALQIIRNVITENRYSVFDKGSIDNGVGIEQIIVDLVESLPYNKEGPDALKPLAREIPVRYFQDWTQKKFKQTIYDNEIRKIMLRDGNREELSEKLVTSLVESDKYERYEDLKALLEYGTTTLFDESDTSGPTLIVNKGTATTYNQALIMLKNIISSFAFVKTTNNGAGIKMTTPRSRIRILMPYTLKNSIDVDALAGVFNLSKAEINDKIIEIDTEDNKVYIVDEWAILLYTRLYEMRTEYNADGLFMNYYLHNDRLNAISPLFNACYFTVDVA